MSSLKEKYQMMQFQELKNSRNGKRIRLRWNNPTEVRRSLSKVNAMVINQELDPKSANAIYYSANLILKALELERDGG